MSKSRITPLSYALANGGPPTGINRAFRAVERRLIFDELHMTMEFEWQRLVPAWATNRYCLFVMWGEHHGKFLGAFDTHAAAESAAYNDLVPRWGEVMYTLPTCVTHRPPTCTKSYRDAVAGRC